MYRDAITLYNYHTATGCWYTAEFGNVNFSELKSGTGTQHGVTSADTVEIILHTRADKTVETAQGVLQYIGPKAYAALVDPTGYFTFCPAQDFVVAGSCPLEQPVAEDDYENGLFHALNRKRDEVYQITSAAWYGLLPHFEVGAR